MDIQKYQQVMQRIKGRIEYINSIYSSAESMGKVSVFMVETICLQLRMTIENIAVACIIANAGEMSEMANKLKKEYRPKEILKSLELINPKCYPIPMMENVSGSRGRFRDVNERPEGNWLAREEVTSEYGKLGNFVHENLKNYSGHPIKFGEMYQKTKVLTSRICNLLSHHQVTVLDENRMYRVVFPPGTHDTVQVATFERLNITDEEFKRMITSESLKTD